jgi:hypothetical protein
MPEGLLTILRLCLLALLYLFLWRVLRVIALELRVERLAVPPVGAGPPPPGARPAAADRRRGPGGRVVVVEPAGRAGETFALGEEETIGRAPGCGIRLDDTYVSQVHARLYRRDRHLFVEDLGSTNGTFVNGTRIGGPVRLRRGDRLQVGGTVLEVGR